MPAGQGARGDTKISKLDGAVFCGEDIGSFDVTVNDTLVVKILQALEDLGHVHADQIFGELAVCLAYRVKRAILTVSANASALSLFP